MRMGLRYDSGVMVIFLTRSWQGTGGMQRYSRDLASCIERDDQRSIICHPTQRGLIGLIAFSFRALWLGLVHGKKMQIHLGDASLLPLGALIKLFRGSRLSVTVHGLDIIYSPFWYQWMMHFFIRSADCIVAVSEATAAEARRRGGKNVTVIPCGIFLGDHPQRVPSKNPTLITVGRLVRRKGVAWFVQEVMPILLRDFPALRYRIVGSGPEEAAIRAAMRGMEDHITLQSDVSDAQRDQLIMTSDVFVMPNVHVKGDMEGFGIACIEASAQGVPVAAARIEGLMDAVRENETGLFFESGDAADCARVIAQFLKNPMNAARVSEATVQHYDWNFLYTLYKHDVFN
jgi:phosphatidylinositol alpha-1,6-mannosyltransferase